MGHDKTKPLLNVDTQEKDSLYSVEDEYKPKIAGADVRKLRREIGVRGISACFLLFHDHTTYLNHLPMIVPKMAPSANGKNKNLPLNIIITMKSGIKTKDIISTSSSTYFPRIFRS